jgi:phosphoribosylglycinamide formyltransferase-1
VAATPAIVGPAAAARIRAVGDGCYGPVVDDLQARRDRLVRLCRTLPEATVTAHAQHLGFAVGGRSFAWYVDDEGGDGRVAVLCKTPPGENAGLVASDPHRFYLPRYVGKRGWVALRLDLQDVDWGEVAELVADSYRLVAPRRLAGLVSRPPT